MATEPLPSDPAEDSGTGTGFQATDTGRVEAFSDAVLAVAITILALDVRTPAHHDDGLFRALVHQLHRFCQV